MNEENTNITTDVVETNEVTGTTQPATKEVVDNSQFKKVREATEAKVAKRYESKIEDMLGQFEALKTDFESQLNKRDKQINQLKSFTHEVTKEADINAIRGIGIPEANLEDAYEFAQINPKDENLGDKLVRYFGGVGANPASGTIPTNTTRTKEATDDLLKSYGLA